MRAMLSIFYPHLGACYSYFTIHVTPQPEFSFVSFETDVDMDDYTELVHRVLSTFKPGNVTITMVGNKVS